MMEEKTMGVRMSSGSMLNFVAMKYGTTLNIPSKCSRSKISNSDESGKKKLLSENEEISR
jgi:hypothetical protein